MAELDMDGATAAAMARERSSGGRAREEASGDRRPAQSARRSSCPRPHSRPRLRSIKTALSHGKSSSKPRSWPGRAAAPVDELGRSTSRGAVCTAESLSHRFPRPGVMRVVTLTVLTLPRLPRQVCDIRPPSFSTGRASERDLRGSSARGFSRSGRRLSRRAQPSSTERQGEGRMQG